MIGEVQHARGTFPRPFLPCIVVLSRGDLLSGPPSVFFDVEDLQLCECPVVDAGVGWHSDLYALYITFEVPAFFPNTDRPPH